MKGQKPQKVLKFGGTSMGSAEAMRQVITVVRRPRQDTRTAAVVVSAMSGVTDQLICIAKLAAARDKSYKKLLTVLEKRHLETARVLISKKHRPKALANLERLLGHLDDVVRGIELVQEVSPRALDYVMSYGERLSAHILTDAFIDRGTAAEYVDARSIIVTNDTFNEAAVDFKATNAAVRKHFRKHPKLQVITGFIGATPDKATTTLGRGGSDYTAAIIGAALHARSIELWTDVSGVMTADPRKVADARPISSMTYQEAAEMSFFGAKVIHPPTMQPALERSIPLLIKNTFSPDAQGTLIAKKAQRDDELARGISSVSRIAMLQIEGSGMVGTRATASRLFGALSRVRVNPILITQASSQHSISIAVAPNEADRARHAIEEEFTLERRAHLIDAVTVERDLCIVAVVGEGLRNQVGVAGRFFRALAKSGINIVAIAQGSSELNISVVVSKADEIRALKAAHAAFFSPHSTFITVFLVGTGLIGSTLLKQIAAQKERLAREHGYVIRIAAVADGRVMHFDHAGISPSGWRAALRESKTRMNLRKFVDEVKRAEIPDSVFVDCTASEDVAGRYGELLGAGVSVVTPNKKANSGNLREYRDLKRLAAKRGVEFHYETNVGAGLPVISTLHDLILSGDGILKIQGVLSGTLSYLFNTFTGSVLFSEAVREARRLGYTEPDPRDDLAGTDVARKILILGREIGLPLELKDVKVESLLSTKAAAAKSVDAFFVQLEKENLLFEKKKKTAEKKGKRLRYIATLEGGKARVSLQAVSPSHPFYTLSGSDNIIAFTTKRYSGTPLVIRGPGAGAEVTAAGVFADILRTATNAL